MLRCALTTVVAVLLVTGGCKKDREAVYLHDVDVSDNARQPLPASSLRLSYSADLTKVRVGSDPDLSDLRPPRKFTDEDAEMIKTMPADMIDLAVENAWEDIPSFFVPDQEEQLAKFVDIVTPTMEKLTALNTLIEDKLGPPPAGMMPPGMSLDPAKQLEQVKAMLNLAQVKPIDGEHAEMTVALGPQPLTVPFVMLEGEWYIEIKDFPAAEQIDMVKAMIEGVLPSMTASIDDITAKVEDGTITDYPGLIGTLTPLIEQMQLFGGGMGGAAPAAAEAEDDNGNK